jgi:hypothetical protein
MQPGATQENDPAEGPAVSRPESGPPSRRRALGEGRRWLSEPRLTVVVVLCAVVVLGGAWKLLRAWKTRRLIARLGEPDVTPAEIGAVASCGRAGLPELFRLLGEAPSSELRLAAARAIAALWAQDELIGEEEQALVRRAYEVAWRARRRYPRALRTEIPIIVEFGVSFCTDEGPGISPANLEWSHRITGAQRAALEQDSEWRSGPGRFRFSIVPDDFETGRPHRLAFHARVRTKGLTGDWQVELPAVPFNFEFDPRLEVSSLLTLPDEVRGEELGRKIGLERAAGADGRAPRFVPLNADLALRDPPAVSVETPLLCDLAHRMSIEFEGVEGRFESGLLVLGGQGGVGRGNPDPAGRRTYPIESLAPVPPGLIDRPGQRRMRAVLEPDPELGWADPDVRSIWPGTIATEWCDVEVVRR